MSNSDYTLFDVIKSYIYTLLLANIRRNNKNTPPKWYNLCVISLLVLSFQLFQPSFYTLFCSFLTLLCDGSLNGKAW